MKTSIEEQKFKVFLAKLSGSLVPTLTMDSGLDTSLLSRDPQVGLSVDADPLCHTKVTASWGKSIMKAIALDYANAACFPLPLLLMHGTQDEIAYPTSSHIFAEAAPNDKVTLKLWEGFKYELHTDPNKAEVFKTMIDWLDHH